MRRARRTVPPDILHDVSRRQKLADFITLCGERMDPLGHPMGTRPIRGNLKYTGNGVPTYFHEEGDEDMNKGQGQEPPNGTTASLLDEARVQSQALANEEDKMDTG